MKLPGINYKTAVGPDVSALPLQEARAWSNATDAWAQAIDSVGREFDAVKAQEAAIGAMGEMAEVEALSKRGVWNVAELGEPPVDLKIATRTNSGQQATYQMHEFADQYYDKRLKEVQEKYGKGLSIRAKRSFTKDLMGRAASQRSGILERQYKQRIDINKATIRKVNDDLIAQATPSNAGQTVQQIRSNIDNAMKLGYFTHEEARKAENDRVADVEYTLYTNALRTNDLSKLEEVQNAITTNPSRMSVTTKNQIWTQAQRKIDTQSRKFESDRKEITEDESARKRNIVLAMIAESEDTLEYGPLLEMELTPADSRIVLSAAIQKNKIGKTEGDPNVINNVTSLVLGLNNPSGRPISERKAHALNVIADNADQLGNRALTLANQVNAMEALPYKSEAYKRAEQEIDIVLVGVSRESDGFGTADEINKANANRMRSDMQEAAQQEGRSFDSQGWVDKNMERYMRPAAREQMKTLQDSKWEYLIHYKEDGTSPNFLKTRNNIYERYKNGALSKTEADDAEAFLMQRIRQVEEWTK